jgi:succinate dehydrogenase/fumarate reductase flavoprotein subunit
MEAEKPLKCKNGTSAFDMKKKIQRVMSDAMIFDRNGKDLEQALSELARIRREDYENLSVSNTSKTFNIEWMEALEARNMLDVAEMSVRAAFMREESRGLHHRSDFPETKQEWLKHILVTKNGDQMDFTTEPVTFPYVKPNQEKGGTTK